MYQTAHLPYFTYQSINFVLSFCGSYSGSVLKTSDLFWLPIWGTSGDYCLFCHCQELDLCQDDLKSHELPSLESQC